MSFEVGHRGDLRRLVEFGSDLVWEPTVEAVLGRVAEEAAKLTGARYAAVGVVDASGRALEHFITHGIDDQARRQLGSLPLGRGILGVLISEATPLRLRDLTQDPRAVGFPPGHPPMQSFLGVPLVLRGAVFGSLYLTEKAHGAEFTDDDEELASLIALQAVAAVEQLRAQESRTRRVRVYESLVEIGNALAAELELDRVLELGCRLLHDLVHAELVLVARPEPDGMFRHSAGAGAGADKLVGYRFDPATAKSGRVMQRGRPERVDSMLDDPEADHAAARRADIRAALFAPMLLGNVPLGVLIAINKAGPDPRFGEEDLRTSELFASRLAIAIDMSSRAENEGLQRALRAQEAERRRIARELHDETGQALTSIVLGLGAVDSAVTKEERDAATAHVREITQQAMSELRRLGVELRPPVLDEFGLKPALERLVESINGSHPRLQIELHCDLERRLPDDLETAVYRMVQESLTNVVRHAGASRVSAIVQPTETSISALVEDDGCGFTPGVASEESFGLVAMRERLALLGGTLTIESEPGSGTMVRAEIPLAGD